MENENFRISIPCNGITRNTPVQNLHSWGREDPEHSNGLKMTWEIYSKLGLLNSQPCISNMECFFFYTKCDKWTYLSLTLPSPSSYPRNSYRFWWFLSEYNLRQKFVLWFFFLSSWYFVKTEKWKKKIILVCNFYSFLVFDILVKSMFWNTV